MMLDTEKALSGNMTATAIRLAYQQQDDKCGNAEEMGIKLKKRWLVTQDGRTRHAYQLLDGQARDTDKPFHAELRKIMSPGDPNANSSNIYIRAVMAD